MNDLNLKLCLVSDITYRVTENEAKNNKGLSALKDRMQFLANKLCWLEFSTDEDDQDMGKDLVRFGLYCAWYGWGEFKVIKESFGELTQEEIETYSMLYPGSEIVAPKRKSYVFDGKGGLIDTDDTQAMEIFTEEKKARKARREHVRHKQS